MLTSGIFGTLRETEDDAPSCVEIADGVTIKVARGAVGSWRSQHAEQTARLADEPEEN